jgi:regulatory protein
MDSGEHVGSSSSRNDNLHVRTIKPRGAFSEVYTVRLSEGSSFFVFASSPLATELFPGRDVDSALLESLHREDERVRATEKAFDLLARSEHSTKMLALKLQKRGFSQPLVGEILEKLEAKGYIDNRRFAELFLEVKRRKRKEGRGKLRSRLIDKGIDGEIIDDLLADIDTEEELAALDRAGAPLVAKRGMTKEKLYAGLVRRGFESRLVRRYVEKEFQKT